MSLTRRRPTGLLRWFLRAPIWLYRYRLGWLLGQRFLMLTHLGRKSGQPHNTVIEVVSHDEQSGAYFVAAAWGEHSDWYCNLRKNPAVKVQVGNRSFEARADQLPVSEAEGRLWDYAQRHPAALRELTTVMLGERLPPTRETCQRLAESVPLIALIPGS